MSGFRSLLLLEKCKNMRQMKQIHAQIVMGGFGEDSFALSRIMAFCSDPNKGSLNHASLLFKGIDHPTICIRNTMIKAFLQQGEYIKPIEIYCQVLRDGLCPDDYTLPYVLKACSKLQNPKIGEQIHTHVFKIGFESNIFVGNTLILMYSVCGDMNSAREVFDEIPHRTEVAWTVMINGYSMQGEVEEARVLFDKAPEKDRGIWGSMISGYLQNNCFKEVLMMFRLMQLVGVVEPDEAVFVSVLSACGQVGAKDIGTWIHHYLNRIGLPLGVRLGTALMDMYAKCGELRSARKIFDGMIHRDSVCWNVMILGLAIHGDGLGALELFSRMKKEGFRPDDATFLAIFAACQHSGMVEEGLRMFNSMRVVYGIEPKSEHYGCIVDVLSRAGLFEEAKDIVERIPNSSSSREKGIAWRALLSACAIHGETKLAEIAAENLLKLEDHSGVYVLLSNLYLTAGKYENATKMRRTMKDREVPKIPGCSSIELSGFVHEFVAGEEMHPKMEEIYMLLETMNDLLASASYNYNSDYL